MPDWALLRHAYGPAADVPALLAAAHADAEDRQVWDDLWARLCHQGTVYSASYPSLPALAVMAAQRPAAGYVEPLHLAATIVASNDGPEDFQTICRDYPNDVPALRDMAERNLALADGFADFAYAVQTLMAFEGSDPWNRNLQALADQELILDCPGCSEYLTISFESAPATTAASDDDIPVTTVTPADPAQLHGATARIQSLALRHGQAAVANWSLYLFGTTTCPACGISLDLPAALSR